MKNFRAYALKLVSVRQRSEHELRKRLKEKGAGEDVVQEIIDSFKELGLVDDEDFAREFVRSKVKRHWSWMMIERALKYEFGIGDEFIEKAKEEYSEDAIVEYYAKRFKREGRSPEKVREFLYRKGFGGAFVGEVLDRMSEFS